MGPEELKRRTKSFALRIINVIDGLPNTSAARVIGHQILRCGTSVGSNYRAACRARSKPDFIAKMGIVLEEADETVYWLELLDEAAILPKGKVSDLITEANELIAITVSSIKTARNLKS
jgi:four helix bundle protein